MARKNPAKKKDYRAYIHAPIGEFEEGDAKGYASLVTSDTRSRDEIADKYHRINRAKRANAEIRQERKKKR